MKKSKIYEKMESISNQIIKNDGALIAICKDAKMDDTQILFNVHNHGEIHDLFLMLFGKFPELRSTALHAISMCMDVDDYGDFDDDDDSDDGDDDPVDGTPVLFEACMN